MDGILVVDKPQGMTSHDVVDFIRKRFGLKKAGHAGTLDPMATGVLVVLVGRHTKSFSHVMAGDKEYEASLTLGATSDTGDAWGNIVSSGKEIHPTRSEAETAFRKFLGTTEQYPPMYSSVKIKGKKLYELARKGLSVERKARKITIKSLEITDISLPQISFKLTCSKGTYVRQLCVDIGAALGCGAYLSGLRRTRSGDFGIDEAVRFEELRDMGCDGLEKRLTKKVQDES